MTSLMIKLGIIGGIGIVELIIITIIIGIPIALIIFVIKLINKGKK